MKAQADRTAPSLGGLVAIGSKGMYWLRRAPCFGRQDVGLSPGGAMDRFAMHTGNIMLGNSDDQEALEFLLPPKVEFLRPAYFVLTGGHFRGVLTRPGRTDQIVDHAAVTFAPAGTILSIGVRTRGLRGYLCARPCLTDHPDDEFLSRRRGRFAEEFSWFDPFGRIRVVEGPECSWLREPELFTRQYWTVSRAASDMGIRLDGDAELLARDGNMISDAVADGTVQLTPKGPIVLLKHRQTVGGYPRIFNVISADVDLLAQFYPGQSLRFRKVSMADAVTAARQKCAQLETLRGRYSAAR
jgi:allophanate hydrolase subunit 2